MLMFLMNHQQKARQFFREGYDPQLEHYFCRTLLYLLALNKQTLLLALEKVRS